MPPGFTGPPYDRLVVGLGNPGRKYARTRHNLGFRVVDRFAGRLGVAEWREAAFSQVSGARLEGVRLLLAKPQTFMNRCGDALVPLLRHAGVGLDRTVVIHDDLDLPLGRLRIRERGGHGGHNGVRSLLEAAGTGEFARVRIGIGRPEGGGDVIPYVLGPFAAEEEQALAEVLERATEALACVLTEGPDRAMNRFPT